MVLATPGPRFSQFATFDSNSIIRVKSGCTKKNPGTDLEVGARDLHPKLLRPKVSLPMRILFIMSAKSHLPPPPPTPYKNPESAPVTYKIDDLYTRDIYRFSKTFFLLGSFDTIIKLCWCIMGSSHVLHPLCEASCNIIAFDVQI